MNRDIINYYYLRNEYQQPTPTHRIHGEQNCEHSHNRAPNSQTYPNEDAKMIKEHAYCIIEVASNRKRGKSSEERKKKKKTIDTR